MIHQTLSHFQIIAKLGEGGMGEVYRARDTSLDREVAIKVLPQKFTSDPSRLARFRREAKVLASLNHSNIAGIYEVGEVTPEGEGEAVHFLAMELAEGQDLSTLLERGPLPVGQSLEIARRIAEALEIAHERGIVHRDLKPQNIKIGPDDSVKILDFGLAKALAPTAVASETTRDLSDSPTITYFGTAEGVVLGTAAYMAPEQARGEPVDRRGDIWAFGAVLYEMLTGKRLFPGRTMAEIMASLLSEDVDLDGLPEDVPDSVHSLLVRCLERVPRQRLRDIGEARIALDRIAEGKEWTVFGATVGRGAAPRGASAPSRTPWIVASLATLAAIVLGTLFLLRSPPPGESLAFELAPPVNTRYLIGSGLGHGLVSPDGTKVAFLARGSNPSLWVRTLATGALRELPGTTEAFYPFWSHDSRRLAFFGGNQLRAVDVAGGLPERIETTHPEFSARLEGRGASWSENGSILITPGVSSTIHRLSDRGGVLEQITELDAARRENAHYWPQWLPGNESFLYFVRSAEPEHNGIYLGTLDGEPAVRLVTSRSSGLYAPPRNGGLGHLLWAREGELLAQPMDVERRRLAGEVTVIASDVRVGESHRQLLASVSTGGTLIWTSASAVEPGLALYDRQGDRLGRLQIPPGSVGTPVISPDGQQVLFILAEGGAAHIWLYDFDSRAATQLTTGSGFDNLPIWAPDGEQIFYQDAAGLARMRLGREAQRLLEMGQWARGARPTPTPDGRFLILDEPGEGGDMRYLDLVAPSNTGPLFSEPGREGDQTVSPDGKWMAFAYQPIERIEVVVAPLSRDGDALRLGRPWLPVSNGGGRMPHWRDDGRELVFASPDGLLRAVSVTPAGETLRFGAEDELFALPNSLEWDASPDHQRFVALEEFGGERQTLHGLTNWQNRLSR